MVGPFNSIPKPPNFVVREVSPLFAPLVITIIESIAFVGNCGIRISNLNFKCTHTNLIQIHDKHFDNKSGLSFYSVYYKLILFE